MIYFSFVFGLGLVVGWSVRFWSSCGLLKISLAGSSWFVHYFFIFFFIRSRVDFQFSGQVLPDPCMTTELSMDHWTFCLQELFSSYLKPALPPVILNVVCMLYGYLLLTILCTSLTTNVSSWLIVRCNLVHLAMH